MTPSTELVTPLGQLQAVCENATAALFVMDDLQRCVYMNRAAELLTGYTLAEVQGGPLHDFVHHTRPDGSPFPIGECPIDRVAPQNDREQGEEVFVHKDGRFYPVAFTASPIRSGDRVVGTVIEVRDITAERRRDDESAAMRQLAEYMLREDDLERVAQAVTDSATRLAGAQFGAFFYNTVSTGGDAYMLYALSGAPRAAFAKFDMPRATPMFGPVFRGEGTILSGDVLQDPRYGKLGPHHGMPPGHLPVRSYLAVPVASEDGEVIGGIFLGHPQPHAFTPAHAAVVESLAAQAAIGVSRARLLRTLEAARDRAEAEAKEKERLYQEATRANQMKDVFLATVSHELRTPLTSILGWSDMLASGRLPPERMGEAIATIARSARAQAQIVEDLLDISRIVSGKLQLHIGTVEPLQVVRAAADAVRPAAMARGVRLQVHEADDAGPIAGDPERLQQVMWNLLSNAVKFTDSGGRVDVHVRRGPASVEIEVVDTGRGIEAAFLPRLFDRFSQLDSSSTREHGGLGLGLAIVRQLVEMHGGTVSAASEGAGRGARFLVRLPVSVPAWTDDPRTTRGAPAGAASADATLPDLRGLRLLLVEDDRDTRDMLALLFESRGATVHACASVPDALLAVPDFAPGLVVSDIGMPGADGFEFIRALREQEAASGRSPVPAIALTAYAQDADRARALAHGFHAHVAKPVHPAGLLAVVDSLRDRARPGVPHPVAASG